MEGIVVTPTAIELASLTFNVDINEPVPVNVAPAPIVLGRRVTLVAIQASLLAAITGISAAPLAIPLEDKPPIDFGIALQPILLALGAIEPIGGTRIEPLDHEFGDYPIILGAHVDVIDLGWDIEYVQVLKEFSFPFDNLVQAVHEFTSNFISKINHEFKTSTGQKTTANFAIPFTSTIQNSFTAPFISTVNSSFFIPFNTKISASFTAKCVCSTQAEWTILLSSLCRGGGEFIVKYSVKENTAVANDFKIPIHSAVSNTWTAPINSEHRVNNEFQLPFCHSQQIMSETIFSVLNPQHTWVSTQFKIPISSKERL